MAAEAFVIDPGGAEAALEAIERHATAAGLAPRRFAHASAAVAALRAGSASEPAALVIGPGVGNPLGPRVPCARPGRASSSSRRSPGGSPSCAASSPSRP